MIWFAVYDIIPSRPPPSWTMSSALRHVSAVMQQDPGYTHSYTRAQFCVTQKHSRADKICMNEVKLVWKNDQALQAQDHCPQSRFVSYLTLIPFLTIQIKCPESHRQKVLKQMRIILQCPCDANLINKCQHHHKISYKTHIYYITKHDFVYDIKQNLLGHRSDQFQILQLNTEMLWTVNAIQASKRTWKHHKW